MKTFSVFRLISKLVWTICLLFLSLDHSNAQHVVRGSNVNRQVPKLVDSPLPTPSTNPSPIATSNPPSNSTSASPNAIPNHQAIISPKPVRPDPINVLPTPESQQPIPTIDNSNTQDPELNQSYKEALKEYYSAVRSENQAAIKSYEHNNWALGTHRQAVFTWQLLSGRIIFGVVIFLVLTGVFFSGIQFFIAMKQVSGKKDVQDNEIPPTTLKATLSGIEVSSSILGVIVLMISFLFFYLYLVYVFPITLLSG